MRGEDKWSRDLVRHPLGLRGVVLKLLYGGVYDTTLHYTTLHYTTLHYTSLHYNTLNLVYITLDQTHPGLNLTSNPYTPTSGKTYVYSGIFG